MAVLGDLLAWLLENLFMRWTRPKMEAEHDIEVAEKQAKIVADHTDVDAVASLHDGKF